MRAAKIVSLLTTLFALLPTTGVAESTPPQLVCLNSTTGKMVTRSKCKANETRFASSSYNSRIDPISSSVTTLQGSVTSLQGSATSLQGNVTSLQGNVTTLQSSVTSLQSNMTTAQGDIASLQGSVDAIPQPARVIHVATSGAPYTTITNALAAASALTPTATNPVVVKVGPGSYPLSASSDTVPAHVRLEGSGTGSTILLVPGTTGLLISDNVTISRLTLKPSTSLVSMFIRLNTSGATANMEDISIEGDLTSIPGAVTGLDVNFGSLRVRRARIDMVNAVNVTGIDIHQNAQAEVYDVVVKLSGQASKGVLVDGGFTILDSLLDITSSVSDASTILAHGSDAHVRAQGLRAISYTADNNPTVFIANSATASFDNCYLQSTTTFGGTVDGVVIADSGAAIDIRNSTVITSTGKTGISAYDTGTVRVFGTFISAGPGITSGGGQVICSVITDENYNFSGATCPS